MTKSIENAQVDRLEVEVRWKEDTHTRRWHGDDFLRVR